MSTIAITGASGALGRLVAADLLDDPGDHDVVLLTRDPGQLAHLGAEGAELRRADFDDPASLPEAFAGIDRLLLISTDVIGTRIPQHVAAIDAAAAAGVGFVAYTSIGDPSDSNPAVVAGEHRATEEHLRASGMAWCFLRNGIYAEMVANGAAGALEQGRLLSNDGAGRTTHVARADCAAAAAAVLRGEGHEGRAYDITGPEALDATQRAALIAELGGRPVAVADVDDATYASVLVEHAGLPQGLADELATFGAAARAGYSDAVSPAVERLTGRPPRALRDVLAEVL